MTPAPGSVATAGTTQQDTSVNGKETDTYRQTLLSSFVPGPRMMVNVSLVAPSCVDGFFGNPVLGSGEHCRPCPCPGNPGSDHFNGHSCQADHSSNQIICNCRQGYTGKLLHCSDSSVFLIFTDYFLIFCRSADLYLNLSLEMDIV